VKNWIDSGLAKSHEIAVLYPSSRNPPLWLGKIHGITFFTSATRYSRQRLRHLLLHQPRESRQDYSIKPPKVGP